MAGAVPTKRIVIARYKEDIAWADKLPEDWRLVVIQKETDKEKGDMPNAGREPASFFFAIAKYYDKIQPDDVWVFVQGNPFSHCIDFEVEMTRDMPESFKWLNDTLLTTDASGCPDHPNLPVAEKYSTGSVNRIERHLLTL